MTIVSVLLPLLVMIFFLAIIGIIVWAFSRPRKPVQPLMPPSTSTGGLGAATGPGAAPSWPSGRWHAKVTTPGAITNLSARQGELMLWQGWVALTMSGSGQPEWQVPCNSIRVTRLSFFSMTGAALRFEGSFGTLNLEVSQEQINTFMRNDAKDLRERGYARELANMLAASGAQVM